jgi:hypothetical protein
MTSARCRGCSGMRTWSTCSRLLCHRGMTGGFDAPRSSAAGSSATRHPGGARGRACGGGRADAWRDSASTPGWSTCSRLVVPSRHDWRIRCTAIVGGGVECNSTIPGGARRRRSGAGPRGSRRLADGGRVQLDYPRGDECSGRRGGTAPQPRGGRLAVDLLCHRGMTGGFDAPRSSAAGSSATRPSRGRDERAGRPGGDSASTRGGRLAVDLLCHRGMTGGSGAPRLSAAGSSATRPSRGGGRSTPEIRGCPRGSRRLADGGRVQLDSSRGAGLFVPC